MNQTLKKLSENHYIIYNDSEKGKEGYNYNLTTSKIEKLHRNYEEDSSEWNFLRKITHSFGKELEGVDNRPLSEVEELLLGYDVEKVYMSIFNNKGAGFKMFAKGFKAAMELNKDKLFTIEDMEKAYNYGIAIEYINIKPDFDKFIQPLLPKTQWKIKINEQNKLELV